MVNFQREIRRLRRMAVGKDETFREQVIVYISQLGHLGQSAYYMEAYPTEYAFYKAEARKALGDLVTQIQMSCALLGFDFEEIIMEGFVSFRDRMKDVAGRKDHG